MTVNLTFHLTYDREKDGTLAEFRVKYERFKEHIARLQANGTLPRGETRWSIRHGDRPIPPNNPARAVGFMPRLVHTQGTTIDPERIAM